MRLSPHFVLREFTKSATADSLRNPNTPTTEHLENLKHLASKMEEVRDILGGNPIVITSGYRNPEVNKAVGGVPTSSHAQGLAADFHCYRFGSDFDVANAVANSGLEFDQLIYEIGRNGNTWVHIGFGPRMRRQVFTEKKGVGNFQGIVK